MDQTSNHSEGGVKVFLVVWFWLLALTGVEVFLGYKAFAVRIMIVLLMGLSVIKASLIIAYFMHLRYEKPSMAATLMPALVIVILLMFMVSRIAPGARHKSDWTYTGTVWA